MTEKPYERLLHRELHTHDVKMHYGAQISLLIDVVNYGTNLVPAIFSTSKRTLGDMVVTTVLLKQLVMMLDSFQVLVAEACTEGSALQCRALFEASIYLEWILQSGKEEKALYYYVSNIRKERQWTQRAVPDDPEQKTFFKNLGEFGDALENTKRKLAPQAVSRLKEINEFLSREPYLTVSDNFDRCRGRRPHDPPWHEPLGKKSVRSLSEALGRLHEYEVFYSQTSEAVHGSRYATHVKIKEGRISIEPIRHLEGLKPLLNFAVSVALHTYRKTLEHYRPGQITEFYKRYGENWREAYLNIPDIAYQESEEPPLF